MALLLRREAFLNQGSLKRSIVQPCRVRKPLGIQPSRCFSDSTAAKPLPPLPPRRPPPKSWFSRLRGEKKLPPEGLASGKEIAKALALAVGVQVSVCCMVMTGEALLEQKGTPVDAAIPMACSLGGFAASVVAFRKSLGSPAKWAKRRWYLLLVPLELTSIVSSALFVRTVVVPEAPAVDEAALAELEAVAAALQLKCFDPEQAAAPGGGGGGGGGAVIALPQAVAAWGKVFDKLSDDRGRLTQRGVAGSEDADPAAPLLAAFGISRLVGALKHPEVKFVLDGVFNVLAACQTGGDGPRGGGRDEAGAFGCKEFCMMMLAIESAGEGNVEHQNELLFRLLNTSDSKRLSKRELTRWLELLHANDLSASAFESDALVEGRRFLLWPRARKLSVDELAAAYVRKFGTWAGGREGGHLTFDQFKRLCAESNLRFGMNVFLAHLVEDPSPVSAAATTLQFLVLNPSAGLPKPKPPTGAETDGLKK